MFRPFTGCYQVVTEIKMKIDHIIQMNQPTRCNSFTSLLLDVYVWLNRKSSYNTYRGWTEIEYQNKRYNIKQKDEET
jgi:hypothetical protein